MTEVSWTQKCSQCSDLATTVTGFCKKCYDKNWYMEHREEQSQKAKIYYQENKERILAKQKEYASTPEYKIRRREYDAQPEVRAKTRKSSRDNSYKPGNRFTQAKSAAKTRDIVFSLTKSAYTVLIAMPCHYCNDYFKNSNGETGVGLDRINNDKTIGYIVGNVLPCCGICNFTRSDQWSVEDNKIMIEAVIEFRKNQPKKENEQ